MLGREIDLKPAARIVLSPHHRRPCHFSPNKQSLSDKIHGMRRRKLSLRLILRAWQRVVCRCHRPIMVPAAIYASENSKRIEVLTLSSTTMHECSEKGGMELIGLAFYISFAGVRLATMTYYRQYCRPRRTHADISLSCAMTLHFRNILCAFSER